MQHLDTYFLFFIGFLSTVIFIPFIMKFASTKGYWEENDERKTHSEKVSSFGGMAIYFATSIAMASVVTPSFSDPLMILLLALPLLLIGFIDDLIGIGISSRFVMQVLLGVLVFEMGLQLVDLGSWFLNLGATTLFVVLFINAYNFIDGINGLAGGLGLLGSLFIATLFMNRGETNLAALCLAYGGSLAGFLVYNFRNKAKIFMGDCGSTVMGFLMAAMILAVLKIDVAAGKMTSWPTLLALVSVPIIDLLKVIVWRLLRGRSPVCPDRSHIHHLLVDGVFSHPLAALLLIGWTLCFSLAAYTYPQFFTLANVGVSLVLPYFLILGIRFAKNYRKVKMDKVQVKEVMG